MSIEKDKLIEIANSSDANLEKLKSIEFWQEFGKEGRLASFGVWLIILSVVLFVLVWDLKLHSNLNIPLLLLVVGIAIWMVDQFIVEQIRVFQFAKTSEKIRAARKLSSQESGGKADE
jgi:ABC-type protease/lipase transport system fused ATPase/permease subunit